MSKSRQQIGKGKLINCIFTQIKIDSHNLQFNSPGHRALTVTCQAQLYLEGTILINDKMISKFQFSEFMIMKSDTILHLTFLCSK